MHAFLSNHLLEILASLTGLINLWLVVRGRQLNWLFGIITVSLYFVIFLKVRLYADMSLQLVFLSLQFYGLYQWQAGRTAQKPLTVQRLSRAGRCNTLLLIVSAYGLIGVFLQTFTNSTLVWIDALVTAMSLVAQGLMAKRYLEHWWVWMVVDVVSVGLYLQKSLYFSSGLYVVLLVFCIQGERMWRKYLEAGHSREGALLSGKSP